MEGGGNGGAREGDGAQRGREGREVAHRRGGGGGGRREVARQRRGWRAEGGGRWQWRAEGGGNGGAREGDGAQRGREGREVEGRQGQRRREVEREEPGREMVGVRTCICTGQLGDMGREVRGCAPTPTARRWRELGGGRGRAKKGQRGWAWARRWQEREAVQERLGQSGDGETARTERW